MTIKQLPASTATIDQEWDKVRAKIQEVQLPEGTRTPWLNTDFGNTITLLFGLVSPPITDAECVARANLLRERLAEFRRGAPSTNHAAVAAFFAIHGCEFHGGAARPVRGGGPRGRSGQRGADDSRPFVHSGRPGNVSLPGRPRALYRRFHQNGHGHRP